MLLLLFLSTSKLAEPNKQACFVFFLSFLSLKIIFDTYIDITDTVRQLKDRQRRKYLFYIVFTKLNRLRFCVKRTQIESNCVLLNLLHKKSDWIYILWWHFTIAHFFGRCFYLDNIRDCNLGQTTFVLPKITTGLLIGSAFKRRKQFFFAFLNRCVALFSFLNSSKLFYHLS